MIRRTLATLAITGSMAALAACSSADEPTATAETTTAAATTTTTAGRPDLTPAQTDATFLQVLDSYSIDYGNDGGQGAIHLADTVCDGLGRGLRESDLMVILTDPTSTNLTPVDAQNFLNTSIVAYCPEQGK